MMRRLLKKLGKPKKKDKTPHKRLWFNLRSNYSITKKSKNSRMGKGKGKFVRKNIVVPSKFILIEFDGWTYKALRFVCFRFKTKANIRFKVFIKNKKKIVLFAETLDIIMNLYIAIEVVVSFDISRACACW